MPFERESLVPVCTSPTFICISKGSEIQRVSVFAQPLYSEFNQFSRYRNGTNGIRKKIVCIRLYLSYFRLYLKGFGDTTRFSFCPCKTNLANFQDIEMEPRYENWLSLFYRSRAKTETRCISEPFEVQTKVGEVQTGTNDSLSNGINEIKKILKLRAGHFLFFIFFV